MGCLFRLCQNWSQTGHDETPLYSGMGYSRMRLLLQQNKTYTNMKPAVSLRGLDRVLLSTLAGEVPTGISLMNVGIRKHLPPLINPLNNNSLGDNSAGVALEGVDMDGVPPLISPSLTNTRPINDNYCVGPTSIQVPQFQLDPRVVQNRVISKDQGLNSSLCPTVINPVISKTVVPVISKTLKLDVSYHVADHAHTVPLHGLPQKKGLIPLHSLNRIKHVKGVCCVSPCISAPLVPNILNAVTGQSVGGRLQKFWHIWQEMGANPRVVSVLRRLHPSLQIETLFDKVPSGSKWLCQSSKEPVLKRNLAQSHGQVGRRKSGCQVVPGILQPVFP